jgi:hypothetical protein
MDMSRYQNEDVGVYQSLTIAMVFGCGSVQVNGLA